ncbi:hypothetical protein [Actinoplanes sp. G11-F43]|uniref:hypothetical protein n=1 Tax=Actinoplanes sp. G11-F43 TaxID=3424130 RepID=UPI003D34A449
MAVMDVENRSAGRLVLWLEPLGEDFWLNPGESVRILSDYRGEESPFTVVYWADEKDRAAGVENLTVSIDQGDCRNTTVTDRSGTTLDCGHQRPDVGDTR